MHFVRPEKLTSRQKEDLMDLLADCRRAEPITLSIPEDADRCLLLYDSPVSIQEKCQRATGQDTAAQETAGQGAAGPLASCLLICDTPDDVWECYAFTRPCSRRKGCFSRLVDEACRMAEEEERKSGRPIDLSFLSDQKSPQGLAAAEALGMTLWYSEHQMELDLGAPGQTLDPCLPADQETDPSGLSGRDPDPKAKPRLLLRCETITEEQEDGPLKSLLFSAYPSLAASAPQRWNAGDMATREAMAPAASPIGTCRLIFYGPSCFYLYHVQIRSDLRGRGWGRAFLDALFQQLPAGSRLTLQVSSLNEPALALYKKTGFRITETLSYYIF